MVLILYLKMTAQNLVELQTLAQTLIKSATNDKDIRFLGVDSNSEITVLTLDMSVSLVRHYLMFGVSVLNSRIFWRCKCKYRRFLC